MTQENEKKGLFQKLIRINKTPKGSCCSIELEEIPEENIKKEDIEKNKKNNSCCG